MNKKVTQLLIALLALDCIAVIFSLAFASATVQRVLILIYWIILYIKNAGDFVNGEKK